MDENHKKVLDMLADGKISAAEAERLLDKLAGGTATARPTGQEEARTSGPPQAAEGKRGAPKYLRVVVQSHDGDNVNVRVPMALIRTGIKMGALLPEQAREELSKHGVDLSEMSNMNADELVEALAELTVDVESSDGDTVRIFCE